MEILIAKKYKIIKKISQGSFGEIFHAININTGQQLAVKLEKIDSKYPQIFHQAKILSTLLNNATITDKGIPNLYYSGQQGDYNVIVMDLLGSNLQQLLKQNGGTFSTKTTLMLFGQMVKRIQYVHFREFLHRDIKPQNFILGRLEKKEKIFIIDFGLSKKYIKNDYHIQYTQGKSMIGTVRYASVNTHLGIQPTRRDDLESLVYIVYYFLYGKLPWQGLNAPTLAEKYNKILALKVQNKPQVFFKTLPVQMKNQFIDIFKHIRSLKFDQKPNYELIKLKIREALLNFGFQNDYIFDWSDSKTKIDSNKKPVSLIKNKMHIKNLSNVTNTHKESNLKLVIQVEEKCKNNKNFKIKKINKLQFKLQKDQKVQKLHQKNIEKQIILEKY